MAVKGLVLFSGGLDSILSVKILQNQGIKIKAVNFKSFFFNSEQARKAAGKLRISLKIVDFSREHLEMVKNPRHGYGKAMNPCIDCHILMLRKAREQMLKEKADFVATGEVLGERPMSQNPRSLRMIEKESSLEGYLLRPLSAKLLEPTIPEKEGKVKREELLGISGRSRKKQIELAKKFKIPWYPTPAGGCLLTDLEFSKKLKKLFQVFSQCQGNDVEILKVGRHFWAGEVEIVVGRDEKENLTIKRLARPGDILVEMKNYPGPLTLARNYSQEKIPDEFLERAKSLTKYYSIKARDRKGVEFKVLVKS